MISTHIEEKNLQFFCTLLMRSNSPMVITDATVPDNPIVFVNPAFEALSGYSAEEAVGQNCRFLQAQDREQPARHVLADAISNKESTECLLRNYRKNGEAFWNQLYIFPVEDGRGRVTNFVGIQHDVSTEKQLLASLQEKQRVIDTSLDVFLKVAADTTILEANASCEAVFGWTPEELIGKSKTCLIPEDRVPHMGAHLRKTLLQSGPRQVTAEYLRKDRTQVFVESVVIPSSDRNALLIVGRDITERRRTECEAVRVGAQLDSILNSITEGCFSVDRNWQCTYINKKGAQWLLQRPEDVVGMNLWEAFPDAVGGEFYKTYHTAMATQEYGQCEQFYLGKWLEARVYPSDDGLTVFFLDITVRKEHEAALVYSATHDSLTGLLNRASCLTSLNTYLLVEPATRAPLAVLFIDLDHFKDVNDAYGHRAGDLVITEIGARLGALSGPNRIVARISGDEFVCILPNTSPVAASEMASQILKSISAPIELLGIEVSVGASIGITVADNAIISADELINQADTAMYAAKANGRHGFSFFNADIDAWSSQRHRLRQEILSALRNEQFELHYQPQLSLSKNKVTGAEALLRWRHPELGLLTPVAFIDIAEESSLIIDLGTWAFNEACRQLAQWQLQGHCPVLSINVSARQLADRHLPELMDQAVKMHSIEPHCIKLEVTESMLAQDFEVASEILEDLRQKGFGVALDDFGTGYSNLAYINRLPVTVIKIDRSFVDGIDTSPSSLALINAIVALAKSLGLMVICEGVETPGQRRVLEGTGCDMIQGYLISRPLLPKDFCTKFLRG